MIKTLKAELIKLRGSWLLPLAVAGPVGLGMLAGLAIFSANKTPGWEALLNSLILPLWSLFLLPMLVVAFTALLVQLEHSSRAFEHLLALPTSRWSIFSAKILLAISAVYLMSWLMPLVVWASASCVAAIMGKQIPGQFDVASIMKVTTLVASGALPLTVLQMWIGLRFRSFVVPISIGIVGVLITLAIALTGTTKADWAPYAQPFLIVTRPEAAFVRVQLATSIAVILIPFTLIHLSRREVH
ncbi:MAG: ABC transporter permease [Woeseiaceae bacterium]